MTTTDKVPAASDNSNPFDTGEKLTVVDLSPSERMDIIAAIKRADPSVGEERIPWEALSIKRSIYGDLMGRKADERDVKGDLPKRDSRVRSVRRGATPIAKLLESVRPTISSASPHIKLRLLSRAVGEIHEFPLSSGRTIEADIAEAAELFVLISDLLGDRARQLVESPERAETSREHLQTWEMQTAIAQLAPTWREILNIPPWSPTEGKDNPYGIAFIRFVETLLQPVHPPRNARYSPPLSVETALKNVIEDRKELGLPL